MHIRIFALLTLIPGLAPTVAGQSANAEVATVMAVVDSFHAGLRSGDAPAVERLLADDAVMLEAGGVETRAQYVGKHLPADIEFERAVTTKRTPGEVVIVGDVAWAYSTSEMVGTFQGRAVDLAGVELMVLSRTADGWRIRAISWSSRARPKQ
jgi:ketosteroid isomerase-like protein